MRSLLPSWGTNAASRRKPRGYTSMHQRTATAWAKHEPRVPHLHSVALLCVDAVSSLAPGVDIVSVAAVARLSCSGSRRARATPAGARR